MADVQDDEQWLYGDDDGIANATEGAEGEAETEESDSNLVPDTDKANGEEKTEETEVSGEKDTKGGEGKENDKEEGGDSSDDDDFTITIGELKKAAEVMTPAQHQARFQPKAAPTSGLKDDDFASAGKVNGVPVAELTNTDDNDKPWRKPGTDLSDYFNYGFNEESWFKYCDRQKKMRVHESGTGLSSLGVNLSKPFGNIVPQQNDNSKYGDASNILVSGGRANRPVPPIPIKRPDPKSNANTIQVMTADRREYSSKMMNQPPPFVGGPPPPHMMVAGGGGYDNMEFGGNAFMGPDNNGYFPPTGPPGPPTNYYNTPPPTATSFPPNNWSNPPPPVGAPLPVIMPSARGWGGEAPPTPALPPRSNTPAPSYREREHDSDEDRRRARRHRRMSPSPPRSRHRSRSRSRSPSHKHKRKKSKRDRED